MEKTDNLLLIDYKAYERIKLHLLSEPIRLLILYGDMYGFVKCETWSLIELVDELALYMLNDEYHVRN